MVPAANLLPIPEGFSSEAAAAAGLVFVTAWRGLIHRAGLRAGERVLVTGGSGGVGTAAIQIAKMAGAKVYVLTSGSKNVERARELGADVVYDRNRVEDFSREIWQDTGKKGVHVAFDAVGEAVWQQCLKALGVGGRLVTYGATTGRPGEHGDPRRLLEAALHPREHDGQARGVPGGDGPRVRTAPAPDDPRGASVGPGAAGPRDAGRGRGVREAGARAVRRWGMADGTPPWTPGWEDHLQRRDAPMDLREAQRRVDAWISQFEEGYWPPLSNLARLTEEVGELARLMNHRFGHKPKRPDEAEQDLALELADILFVLLVIANEQHIDLDDALERTLEKYRARDSERWTRKETDEPVA